jgi:AraC-like DNA-binding protein
MLDEIHEHYADRLNLATLARMLGRQAAYLGRLFRNEIGMTVHDYVTRVRIDRGASQVKSGVKIEAVALCIGYRSKKNFYRQFKRYHGCTPEEYRHRRGAVESAQTAGVTAGEAPSGQTAAGTDGRGERVHRSAAAKARMAVDRSRQLRLKLTILAQQLVLNTFVPSPLALLLTDHTGRCVGANRAAVSMTGYSGIDLRQMHLDTLLEFEQQPGSAALLIILLLPSAHFAANAVLRTKSSGAVAVHCLSTSNPISNRDEIASILAKSYAA